MSSLLFIYLFIFTKNHIFLIFFTKNEFQNKAYFALNLLMSSIIFKNNLEFKKYI